MSQNVNAAFFFVHPSRSALTPCFVLVCCFRYGHVVCKCRFFIAHTVLYLWVIILFSICTQTVSVVNDAFDDDDDTKNYTHIRSKKKNAAFATATEHTKQQNPSQTISIEMRRVKKNNNKNSSSNDSVFFSPFIPFLLVFYFSRPHIWPCVCLLIAHYIFHVVCRVATVRLTLVVLLFGRASLVCAHFFFTSPSE